MTIKDFAKRSKASTVQIYFTNDIVVPYWGGTVSQLKEDIKTDKMLGKFNVIKNLKGNKVVGSRVDRVLYIR